MTRPYNSGPRWRVQPTIVQSRALSISLGISVLVHVAGLVYLGTREPEPPAASQSALELVWIEVPGTEEPDAEGPIEVELDGDGELDVELAEASPVDGAQDPRLASAEPAVGAASPGSPALSLPASGADGATALQPADSTASALAMRTARPADRRDESMPDSSPPRPAIQGGAIVGAVQAAREVIRDPGPPPPPPPPHPLEMPTVTLPGGMNKVKDGPRSELRPDGNGTYRAEDLTFNAKIGRDGRVAITDKRNLQLHVPKVKDIAKGLARSSEAWADSSYEEKRAGTWGGGDGGGTGMVTAATFDLTDWAERAAGNDPYYNRKKKFLDRTREERAGMARVEKTRVIDESLDQLSTRLVRIWRSRKWSPAKRRQVLFQLWDECAETGSAQLVAAGDRAREQIIAFIRLKLPKGSEHGYTAAELAALNGKRDSKRRFAPYR